MLLPTRRATGYTFLAILIAGAVLHLGAHMADTRAMRTYHALASPATYDRTGTLISVGHNAREQVCLFLPSYPEALRALVLAKEDAWFYVHPGIHPSRIALALWGHLTGNPSGGASTVTQQLARTILNTSGERTLSHKLKETLFAFALEYKHSKEEILTMYLNTVPLGGNIQGMPAAARAYFDKPVHALNESETLQLVVALSRPNSARPRTDTNFSRALLLAHALETPPPLSPPPGGTPVGTAWLERADLMAGCPLCTTSLDIALTERIRDILKRHLAHTSSYRGTHGAVAVIDVQSGDILALVGSPAPEETQDGMRINMALATRPIGSTIKPFLFLRAFEKGARPYSTVEDREITFDIGSGFPLYPKNYDGTYRGTVTLEEALANSLNIPAVQVQRFVTLPDTYAYLGETVGFIPPQPWESYSYGIALGGLELDLLTLTHAFTVFARGGTRPPLVAGTTPEGTPFFFTPPHLSSTAHVHIAAPEHTALVHAILSDRTAGVEQFGTRGSLHLSREGYGVKTGTSRDYHDSWTVGYTGDYAVGVWMGNAENKPMHAVSGALGAGSIWREVMELLFTTPYYEGTRITTPMLVRVQSTRGYSYGLPDDDVETARTLLMGSDLIITPHDGDTFLFTEGMRIPLTTREGANKDTAWYVDDTLLPRPEFRPTRPGTYVLTARTLTETEHVTIRVVDTPEPVPQSHEG